VRAVGIGIIAGGECVHDGRECKTSLILPSVIQKAKPDKSEQVCCVNSQATVQKSGREARWLQGFRASMLCEKGRNTGSSEFLKLVLLMGRHIDFLLSPYGSSTMRFERHCEMAS